MPHHRRPFHGIEHRRVRRPHRPARRARSPAASFAAVLNGPADAGVARRWQCRVNRGGRVRMSGTAHRFRCTRARRRRPRSPATRLAPDWLPRTPRPSWPAGLVDVNGVLPPRHSLEPAHKGTARWVGSSAVDTCVRCLFLCVGVSTAEAREVRVGRRDVVRSWCFGYWALWWCL